MHTDTLSGTVLNVYLCFSAMILVKLAKCKDNNHTFVLLH